MAYTKDEAKKIFVQMDEAYKLARQGNAAGYKADMGKAFGMLQGVDNVPNLEYLGDFLAPYFTAETEDGRKISIDDAVKNAGKPGFAASTDSAILRIHERAQGSFLSPYLKRYGDVPKITDVEEEKARVGKNLKELIQELSQPTQPTP